MRALVLGVPLVASGVAVSVAARSSLLADHRWLRLLLILAIAVGVAAGVERVTRRLLPLAALLKLTMIFPDRAPSRFKIARVASGRNRDELVFQGPEATATSVAESVLALVSALGAHDRKTRGHSERVRVFADMVADELRLPTGDRDRLRWAALLHDLGKLHIPAVVLNKPAKLDNDEFALIKRHPVIGADLAAALLPWLGEWGHGIMDHHERYDGKGYPNGAAGQNISLAGRIVGVVDSFETMTAARAYKKPMATKSARRELAACAGSQFDPMVVRAFLAISLPKLMWAMGPLSFVVQAPFLRSIAEAGARGGALTTQTAATAASAAVLATTGAIAVPALQQPAPAAAASTTAATQSSLPVPDLDRLQRRSAAAAPHDALAAPAAEQELPVPSPEPVAQPAPGAAAGTGDTDDEPAPDAPGGSVQPGESVQPAVVDPVPQPEPAPSPQPVASEEPSAAPVPPPAEEPAPAVGDSTEVAPVVVTPVLVEPDPVPSSTESPEPAASPEPTPTPTASEVVAVPTPTLSAEPTPTPTASEVVVVPEVVEPTPSPTASEVVIEPTPSPTASEVVIEPTPSPTASEVVVVPEVVDPTPTPTPTVTEVVIDPTPSESPTSTPAPTPMPGQTLVTSVVTTGDGATVTLMPGTYTCSLTPRLRAYPDQTCEGSVSYSGLDPHQRYTLHISGTSGNDTVQWTVEISAVPAGTVAATGWFQSVTGEIRDGLQALRDLIPGIVLRAWELLLGFAAAVLRRLFG